MRAAAYVAAALLLVVGLAACEEDVVAVTGTDNPFTLFGVLSPQLDSQWVRVFPIEDRLVSAEPEPLDARVVSTDLTTGEEYVWEDSIIVDFADQFAHVYWAPFEAVYEHAYRIEVHRSDGASSSVEVVVPTRADIEIREPSIRAGGVMQPVFINKPVPNLINVLVDYAIAFKPNDRGDIISDHIVIPYVLKHRRSDGGWVIPIELRDDFEEVAGRLFREVEVGIDQRVGIILLNMTIRLIVANEDWSPPGGVFDPELIVQPGVLSNVRNGFGFVGAGYRLQHQWIPPENAIVESGFRPQEEIE